MISGYRYDDQLYTDGQTIWSRGDHLAGLTNTEKAVEAALRAHRPDGADVRAASLYAWTDKGLAQRLWRLSRKAHLYELEIAVEDIAHVGDVNHYSAAKDAMEAGEPLAPHLDGYWSGVAASHGTSPRLEVLVRRATVVRRL